MQYPSVFFPEAPGPEAPEEIAAPSVEEILEAVRKDFAQNAPQSQAVGPEVPPDHVAPRSSAGRTAFPVVDERGPQRAQLRDLRSVAEGLGGFHAPAHAWSRGGAILDEPPKDGFVAENIREEMGRLEDRVMPSERQAVGRMLGIEVPEGFSWSRLTKLFPAISDMRQVELADRRAEQTEAHFQQSQDMANARLEEDRRQWDQGKALREEQMKNLQDERTQRNLDRDADRALKEQQFSHKKYTDELDDLYRRRTAALAEKKAMRLTSEDLGKVTDMKGVVDHIDLLLPKLDEVEMQGPYLGRLNSILSKFGADSPEGMLVRQELAEILATYVVSRSGKAATDTERKFLQRVIPSYELKGSTVKEMLLNLRQMVWRDYNGFISLRERAGYDVRNFAPEQIMPSAVGPKPAGTDLSQIKGPWDTDPAPAATGKAAAARPQGVPADWEMVEYNGRQVWLSPEKARAARDRIAAHQASQGR